MVTSPAHAEFVEQSWCDRENVRQRRVLIAAIALSEANGGYCGSACEEAAAVTFVVSIADERGVSVAEAMVHADEDVVLGGRLRTDRAVVTGHGSCAVIRQRIEAIDEGRGHRAGAVQRDRAVRKRHAAGGILDGRGEFCEDSLSFQWGGYRVSKAKAAGVAIVRIRAEEKRPILLNRP